MLKYIYLVLFLLFFFPNLNAQIITGNLILIEGSGVLYRDNKPRPIPKTKIIIKDKDLIQTKKNGKIKILLFGGDEIFLAPNSEIKFEEKVKLVGLAKKINRSFNLSGRLLAKIKNNLSRETNIRTVNAIVGVKGTDFIVEYVNDNTRVGKIEGTVIVTFVENKEEPRLRQIYRHLYTTQKPNPLALKRIALDFSRPPKETSNCHIISSCF